MESRIEVCIYCPVVRHTIQTAGVAANAQMQTKDDSDRTESTLAVGHAPTHQKIRASINTAQVMPVMV
jgi:hypothetical protein